MRLAVILLSTLLSGCSSQSATLVNDQGEKRYCYKPASGVFSNIGATQEFTRCINTAGSAGFRLLDQ